MSRINLEEIGRRAGVSRSTVSRVVNGSPNVSPEARSKVEAVIAETSYRPHAAARSLASSRTGVVGLVIPSAADSLFDDPYFGRLILGVTSASNAYGVTVALFLFDQNSQDQVIPQVVNTGLLDGAIVTATQMGNPIFSQLRSFGLPHVVVGRPDDPEVAFSVDADNVGGARTAAEHLVEMGRERPAFISAPLDTTAGVDRRRGFLAGLEQAGFDLGGRELAGSWTEESGREAMAQLLETEPDSVFAASDRMAVGALKALREAGVSCPEEVAIVGFDGLLPPEQVLPALTSIVQPVSEVGERAAVLLRSVIDGSCHDSEHIVLPTELVARGSSVVEI